MKSQLLTNARLVLEDTVEQADLLIENGAISAINPTTTGDSERVDLQGCLLAPGLIDLHCDALEKEAEPRPGVHFPFEFASALADKRNAVAGITTVYHALSFANHELGVRNNTVAADLARAMARHQASAMVDNRIHARYEVTDETAPEILNGLLAEGALQMLSFMDHSPGQGQFRDVEAYRNYLAKTYKTTSDDVDAILDHKRAAARGAMARMEGLAEQARQYGVPLASHDDDSPEKVAVLKGLGARISEFPINLETAIAARESGLSTLFGAPNILRNASQSGNMRAIEAIKEQVADCLCGDYSPAALLPAVLHLVDTGQLSLPEAFALVTRNPARAAGLDDRGVIAPGKRADLIAITGSGPLAQASHVWSQGKEVLRWRTH
ncbi:alpha-D-ribose 1-methylphosphonate 5-triphosphate diphosphatase [Saccharospirillum impatiens]|uniref:alpha-D-ribose 1-methylphosphonate 5-triphosphate diphosphatase n=1 Tax=Saccharospirillum impatiens TaxID=169438 RepID=UPI0003F74354|nr:alpha-D-ribose 1-methylphosphonate 5-triphosphate diphosphatase [Saccharospirillum impatiens]